jgi:hypothetical protein
MHVSNYFVMRVGRERAGMLFSEAILLQQKKYEYYYL